MPSTGSGSVLDAKNPKKIKVLHAILRLGRVVKKKLRRFRLRKKLEGPLDRMDAQLLSENFQSGADDEVNVFLARGRARASCRFSCACLYCFVCGCSLRMCLGFRARECSLLWCLLSCVCVFSSDKPPFAELAVT